MSLFKNAIAFRIAAGWQCPPLEDLEATLQRRTFSPCGPTEQESTGWLAPRGEEHGALAEKIDNQLIVKFAVERKSVPAGAIKAELEARCKDIEAKTGRKPGRKEKVAMKDEIIQDFMPRAFSKRSSHFAWVDADNGFLVVGAGSPKAADHVVNHVLEAMADSGHMMALQPLVTELAPSTAMAEWLTTQQAPACFSVDRDLELKSFDEGKASVRYARHNLELEEIVKHISDGKVPTQLGMTWEGRVSFLLTSGLVLKKLEMLEVVADSGSAEGFDGDVALTTGELSKLLPDLLAALGGEVPPVAAV